MAESSGNPIDILNDSMHFKNNCWYCSWFYYYIDHCFH